MEDTQVVEEAETSDGQVVGGMEVVEEAETSDGQVVGEMEDTQVVEEAETSDGQVVGGMEDTQVVEEAETSDGQVVGEMEDTQVVEETETSDGQVVGGMEDTQVVEETETSDGQVVGGMEVVEEAETSGGQVVGGMEDTQVVEETETSDGQVVGGMEVVEEAETSDGQVVGEMEDTQVVEETETSDGQVVGEMEDTQVVEETETSDGQVVGGMEDTQVVEETETSDGQVVGGMEVVEEAETSGGQVVGGMEDTQVVEETETSDGQVVGGMEVVEEAETSDGQVVGEMEDTQVVEETETSDGQVVGGMEDTQVVEETETSDGQVVGGMEVVEEAETSDGQVVGEMEDTQVVEEAETSDGQVVGEMEDTQVVEETETSDGQVVGGMEVVEEAETSDGQVVGGMEDTQVVEETETSDGQVVGGMEDTQVVEETETSDGQVVGGMEDTQVVEETETSDGQVVGGMEDTQVVEETETSDGQVVGGMEDTQVVEETETSDGQVVGAMEVVEEAETSDGQVVGGMEDTQVVEETETSGGQVVGGMEDVMGEIWEEYIDACDGDPDYEMVSDTTDGSADDYESESDDYSDILPVQSKITNKKKLQVVSRENSNWDPAEVDAIVADVLNDCEEKEQQLNETNSLVSEDKENQEKNASQPQNYDVSAVGDTSDKSGTITNNQSLEDEDSHFTRDIAPEECTFDVKYPQIFTKTYGPHNEKSKSGRSYDVVHACFYCKKLFTNIQTHIINKHPHQPEVKEITEMKQSLNTLDDNSNERKEVALQIKQKQGILRNKGDNVHNQAVLKEKKGELLLARRKKEDKLCIDEYGPCPNCFQWIVLSTSITKHQGTCPARNNVSSWHKGGSIIQAKILSGRIQNSPSKLLVKEVFSIMRRDAITEVAINDALITTLGNVWMMKSIDNKMRRKHFASFHMRLAARLLTLLRVKCEQNTATMFELLTPRNFDKFADCALEACSDDETSNLQHPSTAIKLGYNIMRLAAAKLGYCIKQSDETGRQDVTNFLSLMKLEFGTKVTKLARVTLNERQFNKKNELPLPNDIAKLSKYLLEEIKNVDLTKKETNTFRRVVILAETRLLTYIPKQKK